ncbi:MAG TPA: threonine ammonia-lyase [Tepidisphaeraceae bacterium]|jgi:threonine dehydratase|nr:threonine ammonia-lyase [Tepidisphaeraceae bacterium]
MSVTLEMIREARERIRGAVYESPCVHSLLLSRLCGCEVYCKLDHLQMTGSFKERGARNKLMLLPAGQKHAGVIAASAGNHALGLAYHGELLGVPVTVVMPKWAPIVKVSKTRTFGAEVILFGESFDEAHGHAKKMAAERGLTFVPGFDDEDIIAGQGTIGLEVMEQVPGVDAVFVPVGGGGLLAGVGTAVKGIRASVKVIGVEPANAPTLKVSLEKGVPTGVTASATLADGLAVRQVGTICLETAKHVLDDLVLVDEAQIARAVLQLLELEKMVVEGSGAVSLAAAVRAKEMGLAGKKVVLLLTGGNIDVTMLARVIERGMAAEGRLCRVRAQIIDRPGSLAHFTAVLATTGASVKQVEHDRDFGPADVSLVGVVCTLETKGFEHIEEVKRALEEAGVRFSMEK